MSDSTNNPLNEGANAPRQEGSADRSASGPSVQQPLHATSTPEFGQYKEPEYGQLANQYPGWDPYVYGKPEPKESKEDSKQQNQQAQQSRGHQGGGQQGGNQSQLSGNQQQSQNANPFAQFPGQNPNGAGSRQNSSQQNNGQLPFQFQQIVPDDPSKNPFYGRWDGMAIVSFVLSFFIPLISLPLAWLSMRRTRALHMKGHGLAVAALILSLINLIWEIFVITSGINPMDTLMQMYGYVPDSGEDGSTATTAFLENSGK